MVKGLNAGMVPGNEHIIGRLGRAIGAPVPEVVFVEVSQALIDLNPDMAHLRAGLAHGSRMIRGCGDRETFQHTTVPENRLRFALLAALYGWVRMESDHQFIYHDEPPELVWSMDHGHGFPNGPDWSAITLEYAPPAWPDPEIVVPCGLTQDELRKAVNELTRVNDNDIAEIVAGPPEDWGYPMRRRLAMATYLAERRDYMLGNYPLSSSAGN